MSNKELLERITRGPADGKKKAETAAPAAAVSPEAGSKRVAAAGGKVVVRRRPRNEPAPEEVAPAVAHRRRAVALDGASEDEHPQDGARGHDDRAESLHDEVAFEHAEHAPEPSHAEPEVTAASAEPVAAEKPAVDAAPPAVVESPSVAVPEPVKAAEPVRPEPVKAAEPPKADPPRAAEAPRAPEASRPSQSAARPGPRVEAPRPARPVRPQDLGPSASADPTTPAPSDEIPDRPRFEGLGKAVVMPPPGYDPTNPGAFRRRPQPTPAPPGRQVNAAAAAAEEWRKRRAEPAVPAAPEPAGDDANRRARRGRPTAVQDPGMAMRRRPRRKAGPAKTASPEKKASKRKIRVDNVISVGQLAHELGIKAAVVIKQLMALGRMATVNEMLDIDTATLIATEFEYEVVNAGFQEGQFLQHVAAEAEEEGQQSRPPVVTIMGHVDHGKTTLLDAIRAAKVAAGEAGGITQHIGAYQVELDDEKITFIDTPGHAAFSAMRARGSQATDIVVLVVASDDGVQAQTEESIAHARAAGVPIVVAVNKMDKPGATTDPIKKKLADIGLQSEDWGGDTMFVPVSALKRTGIDELLEAILLQAEVLELRANPERHAEGVVIEARVERGRGPVATLLVQKGTLRRGENVVMGATWGRVRAMMDHTGAQIKEAGPSTPVEIFGLSELPETGESFHVVKNEKDARTLAEYRQKEKRESALVQVGRRTAADIFASAEAQTKKVLPVVLRCDVQGSLEALKAALSQITVNGTELRFLHAAVGEISESDVNMAASYGGLLIGFNVKADSMARQACDQQGVAPEYYDVIYAVIDRVTAAMGGLLGPQYREVRMGSAEVRAVFAISKIGKIAGSYITDGKVARSHGVRVMRAGVKVHEGKIATLKRFKEDVREVTSGYECGIGIDGFEDIQVGDVLEAFGREQIPV